MSKDYAKRNESVGQSTDEVAINTGRRRFLLSSAVTSLSGLVFSGGFANAAAQSAATGAPRFLSVFLRGACDTDSVLFQADNSFYYDSRPNIAIGRSGLSGALQELEGGWVVHPALAPLQDLIEGRQFAFMPFFGSGDNSRSHFQAQDVMERILLTPDGQANGTSTDGYVNRVLQQQQRNHPSARLGGFYTGSVNPLACRGPVEMTYVDLKQKVSTDVNRDRRQLDALRQLYADPETSERVILASEKKKEVASVLSGEARMMQDHGANNRTQGDLTSHFVAMADLMKRGGAFSVAFTDIGGWDTHVNQGNETGLLANKLSELANALAQFAQRMGPAWRQTRVLVVSEFGRTFRENGNKGTDHGHGTTVMLAGGKPFEKSVLGATARYSRDMLHEGRDAPILNDQRVLLEALSLPSS